MGWSECLQSVWTLTKKGNQSDYFWMWTCFWITDTVGILVKCIIRAIPGGCKADPTSILIWSSLFLLVVTQGDRFQLITWRNFLIELFKKGIVCLRGVSLCQGLSRGWGKQVEDPAAGIGVAGGWAGKQMLTILSRTKILGLEFLD